MELVQAEITSLLLFSLINVCSYLFSRVHGFLRIIRRVISSKRDGYGNDKTALKVEANSSSGKMSDVEEISMEEWNVVMGKLGLMGCEDEETWKNISVDQLATLFDQEVSVVEIEEAFQVFDENKDGYIDAAELQRILCRLSIKEGGGGYELDECRRMLCAFDDNGDGLIDFAEFVTFMEKLP